MTPDNNKTQLKKALIFFAILLTILLSIYFLPFIFSRYQVAHHIEIPYTKFKSLVNEGRVTEVVFRGHSVGGRLTEPLHLGPKGEMDEGFETHIPAIGDQELLPALEAKGVTIRVEAERKNDFGRFLNEALPWLLILLVPALVLFCLYIFRNYRQIGGELGRPRNLRILLSGRTKKAKVPAVTFEDVAGQENPKHEVQELIDFLKNPEEYRAIGAEVPRGVLLMGPPGCGKTLMAKALAGEAGVPFYSISGSEFMEVFIGVGAARVRNLFETAKENAPSIIFVDELDSVGRTRGAGIGGGSDEREQTLNQILAEMDGFEGHEAVIVLAATNRPDVLDPALLRPGRFDRHVTLDLPDREDRDAIIRAHTRNVPLADDVDIGTLAASTPGYSGADLKNLVNEAALLAVSSKKAKVEMNHFEKALDKMLLGTVRVLAIQPEEHHRLATHEAGHALVAYYLPHADPLYKVTIIPRGHTLGGTMQLPVQERHTLPEEYLRDRLAVMLGGRVAERQLLSSTSSGADDDIKQATALARAMVSRWGMSPKIGPIDLRESDEHPFLGREISQPRTFSEKTAQMLDEAVRQLLLEAEERARQEIDSHRQELACLISTLEEKEILHREEIEACLSQD